MTQSLTRAIPKLFPSAIRWSPPLIFLYIFGGAFGYLGILSSTQTNILVLLLFTHIFALRSSWYESKNEGLLAILILYIVVMGVMQDTAVSSTLTYIYYLLCTIIASVAGRVYAKRFLNSSYAKKWLKYCFIFLVVELVVVIFQHIFSDQLASSAHTPFNPEDAVFGTFFLQSDATLGVFCLLTVVVVFCVETRWFKACTMLVLAAFIIVLGHSKAMQGTFIAIVVPLLVYTIYKQTKLHRYHYLWLSMAFIVSAVALVYSWQILTGGLNDFRAYAENQYVTRDSWITSGRLAPWGQMFLDKGQVFFFGHGALTYYNPITKSWLYNAGFSTFYGLYIDFGIIGIGLYIVYQVLIIIKFSQTLATCCFFLMIWISFAAFNDALSNIEFMFAINFAMCLVAGSAKRLQRSPQRFAYKEY